MKQTKTIYGKAIALLLCICMTALLFPITANALGEDSTLICMTDTSDHIISLMLYRNRSRSIIISDKKTAISAENSAFLSQIQIIDLAGKNKYSKTYKGKTTQQAQRSMVQLSLGDKIIVTTKNPNTIRFTDYQSGNAFDELNLSNNEYEVTYIVTSKGITRIDNVDMTISADVISADGGYYTDDGGNKSGVLKYSAKFTFPEWYTVKEFGIEAAPSRLSDDSSAWAKISSSSDELVSGKIFYTEVKNIPGELFGEDIIAKAYLKFNEISTVYYSDINDKDAVLSVNKTKANGRGKILGTKQPLQCDLNGDFTILIVSDPQSSNSTQWNEATDELRTLVEKSNPDFVLINGDMNSNNDVQEKYITPFVQILEDRGIYWSTTNGNHDPFTSEHHKLYKSYAHCLNQIVDENDPNYESKRPKNYVLPVYSRNGSRTAFAIYGMDSGSTNSAGYEGFTQKQVQWYRSNSNILKDSNNGNAVTSLICCHIPFLQTLDMYYSNKDGSEATLGIPGDAFAPIYGYLNSTKKGTVSYNTVTGTRVHSTGSGIRTTAIKNDTGIFNAIQEQGDVKAAIFGHDHSNNFIGSYNGVLLGYAGKISTGAYYDPHCRGGRVIRFSQSCPEDFEVSWLPSIPTSTAQPAIYSDGTLVKRTNLSISLMLDVTGQSQTWLKKLAG